MLHGNIPVSLSEVVEVRGTGLTEEEAWSMLSKLSKPLRTLMADARTSQVQDCSLSIDTVFLLPDGNLELKCMHKAGLEEVAFPPEYSSDLENNNTQMEPVDLSKAFIYSFGSIVLNSVTTSESSQELLSLLNVMTVADVRIRPSIAKLEQLTEREVEKRSLDCTDVIYSMYSSIMGSLDHGDEDESLPNGQFSDRGSSSEPPASPEPLPRPNGVLANSRSVAETNEKDASSIEEISLSDGRKLPHQSSAEIKDKRLEALNSLNGTNLNSTIGSPIGNSTPGRLEKPANGGSAKERKQWPSENDGNNGWVSFETRSPPLIGDFSGKGKSDGASEGRQDSFLSSSESAKSEEIKSSFFDFSKEKTENSGEQTGQTLPYDLLTESMDSSLKSEPTTQRKSPPATGVKTGNTFSSIFGESPGRGGVASAFDKIMPQGGVEEFTSPKDHGRFEKTRSFHSLDCQYCSPRKGQRVYKSEEDRNSLPNLVAIALSADLSTKTPKHRRHEIYAPTGANRNINPKTITKTMSGKDPFGSFNDIAHPENPVNEKPVRSVRLDSNISTDYSGKEEQIMETEEDRGLEMDANKVSYAEIKKAPIPQPRSTKPQQEPPMEPSVIVGSGRVVTNPNVRRSSNSNFKRAGSKRVSGTSVRRSGGRNKPMKAGPSAAGYNEMAVDDVVPAIKPRKNKGIASNASEQMSPRHGMGGPEFLHKSRLPSIRLKAPARKKAKLLHRSDASSVQVVLLCGQRVEVACRTDSTASDVFDSVVTHTTLTEHYFFGLTILRDGEHFFLETDEKLYKFSPPGWKHQRKNLARNVYTLYLRLKYYPSTLDYIKTGYTLHEMYLQLRRDVVDERLQVKRDVAYQLAALALQAEYGDRPSEVPNYFNTDHYMPHRHLMEELGGEERIRTNLAELHTQYSGMGIDEAETEYLKISQAQREYGIHFYRLYRTKPSQNLTPTPLGDPDTGTPLWVGIMPKGIIIFEEQGGERVPISQYPWLSMESLQFNRKKLVIVPAAKEDDPHRTTLPQMKKIFYTDNYKKSSYFVKFAGTQHRFGMKMRSWAASLGSEQSGRSDSGLGANRLSTTLPPVAVPTNGQASISSSVKSNDSGVPHDISREQSPDDKLPPFSTAKNGTVPPNRGSPDAAPRSAPSTKSHSNSGSTASYGAIEVDVPSGDRTLLETPGKNETMSKSLNERLMEAEQPSRVSPLSSSEYVTFTAFLTKADFGLGLTLVDGDIQGMKGVYVKSLTSDGPAATQGKLRQGDKILSVNAESLDGKNRHDAVNLVKLAGTQVELEILRLKGLYGSSEELEKSTNDASFYPTKLKETGIPPLGVVQKTRTISTISSSSTGAKERGRTMSDMSAISGGVGGNLSALPPYSSQNILQELKLETMKNGSPKDGRISSSQTMPGGFAERGRSEDRHDARRLHPERRALSSMTDKTRSTASSGRSSRASGEGEFRPGDDGFGHPENMANDSGTTDLLAKSPQTRFSPQGPRARPPSQGMYGGLGEDSDSDESMAQSLRGQKPKNLTSQRQNSSDEEVEYTGLRRPSNQSDSVNYRKPASTGKTALPSFDDFDRKSFEGKSRGGLDWASEIDGNVGEMESVEMSDDEDMEEVTVKLEKNERGSLGIKIAGGSRGQNRVYIKALVADPALSCVELRPFDRLISVNGTDTRHMAHHEVVEVLKHADSPVTLGLRRPRISAAINGRSLSEDEKEVEVFTVTLHKPLSGSLGLSLARPAGGEGIYVRVITPDSVAAEEGTLRVGDRLWEINDESVAKASPMEVVEKLKQAEGSVRLVVHRESSSILH